jgi:ketosteroid isomerase-like protein
MKFSSLPFVFFISALIASTGAEAGNTTATEVADQFGQALKENNEPAVRNLLDENVLIFESGSVESSLEEYASHHMSADMAFMQEIEKEIITRSVVENGDMVVISTKYRMFGTYKAQNFDKTSLESLVLKKTEGTWKIVHIHWS